MREMTTPLSSDLEAQVRQAARELYELVPTKRALVGVDFAMDNASQVVIEEIMVELRDGQKLRVAQTRPDARPPFEWLMELTSDIGQADYFKHYLLRQADIVLAERKSLYPIDDQEAQLILHDLQVARTAFDSGDLKVKRTRRT